jgi:hypothetical protein
MPRAKSFRWSLPTKSPISKLCKFTLRLAAASVIVLVPAGVSLADPPGTLTNPGNHRHFIETPDGDRVPVGPDICANQDLQEAFNQFHYNVHRSASGPTAPTETLGPQDGAPGLHDDLGADLAVMGGCG